MQISYSADNLEVIDLLRRGQFVSKQRLMLHLEAEALSVAHDFSRLLTLDACPNLNLYPHQLSAIWQVLRTMRGRAVLADEVGLGKTIEAGVIAKEYLLRGLARRVLVLTPASIVLQWRQELSVKLGLEFAVGGREPSVWEKQDLIVASMDTAKREEHANLIVDRDWDLVIVDEAHHLKNTATLNWQFVNQIRKKFLLLLTATPVQNDLQELYNLITLLKPGQLRTYTKFKQEFMEDRQVARNLPRLRDLLEEVMVRSTRDDTLLPFPRRKVKTIRFNLEGEEAAFYRALLDFARDVYRSMPKEKRNLLPLIVLLKEACSSAPAVVSTLRRFQGGFLAKEPLAGRVSPDLVQHLIRSGSELTFTTKLQHLIKLVSKSQEKLLVFTEFRLTQKLLAAVLEQANIAAVCYHGGLSRSEKEEAMGRFRDSAQVMISTEAGGEGRNLQFCHVVVNYDLPWNPMRVEQRIGRVHRLGQNQDVTVINLCSMGTIEAYIVKLLERKLAMFQDVIGDVDSILSQVDERSFEEVVGEAILSSTTDEEVEACLGSYGDSLSEAVKRHRSVQEFNHKILNQG